LNFQAGNNQPFSFVMPAIRTFDFQMCEYWFTPDNASSFFFNGGREEQRVNEITKILIHLILESRLKDDSNTMKKRTYITSFYPWQVSSHWNQDWLERAQERLDSGRFHRNLSTIQDQWSIYMILCTGSLCECLQFLYCCWRERLLI